MQSPADPTRPPEQSAPTRRLVLFGANGRLGSAVASTASNLRWRVTAIPWRIARNWRDDAALPAIAALIGKEATADDPVDVVFACGLTDPSAPAQDLMFSNAELVERVIVATGTERIGRYLTFGTIMEHVPAMVAGNPYIASKKKIATRLAELGKTPLYRNRITHLRMHTLYGGRPSPHMFLGQLCAALERNTPFAMSHGHQLREYHHVADVARSVIRLLDRKSDVGIAIDLSSANPVTLRELATKVFEAFDRRQLLEMDRLAAPAGEEYVRPMRRSADWLIGRSRDPVPGIIDWLAELLERRPTGPV